MKTSRKPAFAALRRGRQRIELGDHEERWQVRDAVPVYGPEKPLLDKTWKLGDIEEVK